MEKIVAALWAPAGSSRAAFNAELLERLPSVLHDAGASKVRLNVRDDHVAAGEAHIQRWQEPQQDAVVQFWLPSANPVFFARADAALASVSTHHAAWAACESTVIANTAHPPSPGERTWGWSQATFLAFRTDLPAQAAEDHWRTHHTAVAIETQANFEYIQNRLVRPLTDATPEYDAFIEECFPMAALDDPQAFFDATGEEARCQANLATMMDSCGRFIDFARIDVIPTSQYDYD